MGMNHLTDRTGSLFNDEYCSEPVKRVIGIVGVEAAKLTPKTEQQARFLITKLLTQPGVTGYSSGHCHLGGVDILTEEIGESLGLEPFIYPPMSRNWIGGYKDRNTQIASVSNEVHCITVSELPSTYKGMRFDRCYHCDEDTHVKSGGCWTVKYAQKIGKQTFLHVIAEEE